VHAVIFCGIQGAGKSTFYRERFFDTHVRVNMDMLKTRHREKLLLQACIDGKQPFVIDNTNVFAAERAIYILAARSAGFRVTGYYFEAELRSAIWRNKQRQRIVPIAGLLGKWKRLQRPTLEEGFDELWTVRVIGRGYTVEAYSPVPSL
jgi:predicted kinase